MAKKLGDHLRIKRSTKDGKWRWQLWGGNHKLHSGSGSQGYATKRGCIAAIARHRRAWAFAEVISVNAVGRD